MPPHRDPRKKEPPKLKTPWFWWFVAIVCSACFAVLSWIGIDYLFAFPERQSHYELMEKIGRLPETPELKGRDAPEGVTLTPIPLYSQFSSLSDEDREALNLVLKRQLVGGLKETDLIYYIEGSFEVIEIRDLGPDDFVSEGILVKAQALIQPDEFRPPTLYPLFIEYILPNAKSAQKTFYPKGAVIKLSKIPGFCTVLHTAIVSLDRDPYVVLTAIPIVTGPQRTPDEKNISVSLPERYHLSGEFPMWNYEPTPQ